MLKRWNHWISFFLFRTAVPVRQYAIDTALLELPEKAHVILEEELDIIDPVFEHGDPLDTHPKSEPGIELRIIIDKPVDLRVHHA